jgi:PilZ domain
MDSGDTSATTAAERNRPIASATFEVVRRTEFVFEPFLGSLIQLPVAKMQRAQSSEFFLAQSPARAETAATSSDAAEEKGLVWERPFPSPQTAAAQIAEAPPQSQKEKNRKVAREQESPRFYQPQPVRFFDPVAAAEGLEGGGEVLDWQEQSGQRASIQLSAELKAAILRIDEERRKRQHEEEERPEKDRKRGLKTRPAKRAEAQIEIHPLPERISRWKEIAAPAPTAGDADDVNQVATDAGHAEVMADQAVLSAASSVPTRAVVPVESATHEREAVPTAGAVPTAKVDSTPKAVPAEEAMCLDEVEKESAELIAIPETGEAVPVADQLILRMREEPASPPIAMIDSMTTKAVDEEQKTTEPEPSAAARVRATAAMISQVRRADLVREPVETAIPPTPLVKEQMESEEEEISRNQKEKLSLATRLQRWMGREAKSLDGDRRRAERVSLPGLVAFYWSGGTPQPHEIVNISKTGFYLKTKELWSEETLVRMTLQRPSADKKPKGETISVLARVVRIDEDGVGHEFVTTEALLHARSMDVMPSHGTDWRELDKFLQM